MTDDKNKAHPKYKVVYASADMDVSDARSAVSYLYEKDGWGNLKYGGIMDAYGAHVFRLSRKKRLSISRNKGAEHADTDSSTENTAARSSLSTE